MLWICLLSLAAMAPAAPVSVDGSALRSAEGPFQLRGANWGWWHCVESGDADLIASWGGNVLRIAFSASNITGGDGSLGGEGLAFLDTMCRWAEEAGVLFILDFHGPPGGCNTATWCEGGGNALWGDPALQDRFVSLWAQIAQRYRGNSCLLAYELMNEPAPPADYPAESYRALCLRAIDAIREVDPDRPLVVSGLGWSAPEALTEGILLPRPGLVYTFHFYSPGVMTHYEGGDFRYPGPVPTGSAWLSNSPEDQGLAGDNDWTLVEREFTAPAEATHGQVMLRSSDNTGTAWFDDVRLLCDGEAMPLAADPGFARGPAEWKPERVTAGELAWDAAEGCAAPGALRIQGTDSYNAWVMRVQFPARPDARYRLSAMVRTSGATGLSYPGIAWFRTTTETIDREWLRARIQPAIDFGRAHDVPIYCGEFGCSQSVPDGSGLRWVSDVGELLSEAGIHWTYWNWRETTGMGSMGVWSQEQGQYYHNGELGKHLRALWQRPR